MKRLAVPLLILSVLSVTVAFLVVRHSAARRVSPAELLPATTLAYLEVPDFRRTQERWSHTALRELWQEPELQGFLEQPLAKVPQLAAWTKHVDRLSAVRPRRAFAAVISPDGINPHFVAGLAFTGSREALDAFLAEPRAAFRQSYPAGKSDLVTHGSTEIQTFTAGEMTIAETVREGWYFVADDLSALQAVLDRAAQRPGDRRETLAGDEVFRATLKPLPADAEATGFVRLRPLVERISALLTASGQNPDAAALARWKRWQGMGFSSRIEGSEFRDSIFQYAPGSAPEAKLPLSGLALTSPETMFFAATTLPPDLAGQLAAAAKTTGADLSRAGDLLALAGPEVSLMLDWPATAEVKGLLAVPLKAPSTQATAKLDQLTASAGWNLREEGGVKVYSGPPSGLLPIAPSVAVSDRFLLAGLSVESLLAAGKRTGGATLTSTPAWQAALKQMPEPQGAFAFLQTGAFIDRLYGTARPALAMMLALNPASAPYLDASKLPSAPALSKHLGTTVLIRNHLRRRAAYRIAGNSDLSAAISRSRERGRGGGSRSERQPACWDSPLSPRHSGNSGTRRVALA